MRVTKNVHAETMAARHEKRVRRAAAGQQNNENAQDKFMNLVIEIQSLLAEVRDAADGHFFTGPEEVHWGHVGDATWTRDQLKHVLAVIRGEEGK